MIQKIINANSAMSNVLTASTDLIHVFHVIEVIIWLPSIIVAFNVQQSLLIVRIARVLLIVHIAWKDMYHWVIHANYVLIIWKVAAYVSQSANAVNANNNTN